MTIFDLDGTLLHSNDLWVEVDLEFLARHHCQVTKEYEEVVTKATFPSAASFTREYYHLPLTEAQIMQEWEDLAAHHYRDLVELKAGARELLKQYRSQGEALALFTACRPKLCQLALERHGLEPYFAHVVFAEELGLEKHDPRCFKALSHTLGVEPEGCTLLDDSPFNCATARAAGMHTIGVYDPCYASRWEGMPDSCHRFVHSLEELLEG